MKLQEKPYWIQLVVLALFTTGGLLLFSSLSSLVLLLIYHTPSMLDTSDPVTAIRISQTFATIGTFLLPALLFAYCQNRQWFDYNAANRRPNTSMVNIVLLLSITLLPVVSVLSTFNIFIMPQEGAVAEFMRDMEEAANHILEMLTSRRSTWDLISNMLVLAVLAGVCEEFLFQGALHPLIRIYPEICIRGLFGIPFLLESVALAADPGPCIAQRPLHSRGFHSPRKRHRHRQLAIH